MIMCSERHAGQNHNIKMGNTFFENVSQFRYLQTTVADLYCILENIKSGNVC